MKVSSFEELDASMLSWYNESRAAGIPVTSAMCIEQAKFLHERLDMKRSFSASSGWLTRFKQRYGIAGVYTHSKTKAGSSSSADKFCYQFQQVMQNEEWLPDQIYNVDETGLYWNSLPSKTGTDTNATNERITILCCTNATGTHKLDLTIIAKSKYPWNPKDEEFPQTAVNYYEAKGGWASKEIFQHWFQYKWIPEVRAYLTNKILPLRAMLLLDTAPCHITNTALRSEDGCMIVRFMPTDVANWVQPMQQGIVSLLKWNYRTDLLKKCQNDDKHMMHRRIEDAVKELEAGWSKVNSQSIKSAWNKLIPETEQYVVENEIIQTKQEAGWSKENPQSIKSTWNKLIPETEQYVVESEIIQTEREAGWSKVNPQSIKSAWNKLIPETEQYVVESEIIQTNGEETCVVMVDHQTGVVMDFEEVEEIDGEEQIEECMPEGDEIEEDIQEETEEVEEEIQQVGEIEHVEVEQWFNSDEAIIVKEENMVEVAVEFSELGDNPESGDNSGDESKDKRLELHTALTSVETLLGFVDHRGLTNDDKRAFKTIRSDVRKLMKSLESKKNNPDIILS
ncbi:tigger transposable element-derived protein 2-like [Anopheles marshallii]|uniref:tigger transposable element-derived protein 2-like n=1 Tax=Anopheles marshallii TaxID=1521116 RepID=UPI00237A181F|nr:tigger transposable element-derived protein 2-like [Anopheles marshallii]